jgi:hypothetical protein
MVQFFFYLNTDRTTEEFLRENKHSLSFKTRH